MGDANVAVNLAFWIVVAIATAFVGYLVIDGIWRWIHERRRKRHRP
jgi:hypothetical protein